MTEAPAPTRRPVPDEREDTSGRRGCMTVGALLGVAVGLVIALVVMPRVFDHYFGTADIELGKTWEGTDGRTARVIDAERLPDGTFHVRVVLAGDWNTTEAPPRLEVTKVSGRLSPSTQSVEDGAGAVVFQFPPVGVEGAEPRVLHFSDPRVRLHLQPGEPE